MISYYSQSLSKPERKYCVTRKELLAVVKAVKQFHHYLYGRHFIVRSDHGALCWLVNFKNPEGQMARWIEVLSTYDMEIQHRQGRLHSNADALSRRPCVDVECSYCDKVNKKNYTSLVEIGVQTNVEMCGTSENLLEIALRNDASVSPDVAVCCNTVWCNIIITLTEMSKKQRNDHVLNHVMTWKFSGIKPEWKDVSCESIEVKHYWARIDSITLKENGLYKKWESECGKEFTWLIILPKELQKYVIDELHSSRTAGHLGVKRTLERIKCRFYWYNMRKDVQHVCKICDVCTARKRPIKQYQGPMKKYVVGAPMERIALDIMGPLPETEKRDRYILVIADYFTKWTEAVPLPDQEAATVASALIDRFIGVFGIPKEIHSDQGTNF